MNPLPNQWLSRFPVKVMGNLRPLVRQYDDGSGVSTLIPNVFPTKQVESSAPLSDQPSLCTPAEFQNVTFTPADNPFVVGTQYTFSFNNVTGSAPFFYRWLVNDEEKSSNSTLVHTFTNGEINDPDGSNLGYVYVLGVLSNACGLDTGGGPYGLQGT